jgi:hypothetical protein
MCFTSLRGVELQRQEAMTYPALLPGAEPTPLRHVELRPAKGEACPLGMCTNTKGRQAKALCSKGLRHQETRDEHKEKARP